MPQWGKPAGRYEMISGFLCSILIFGGFLSINLMGWEWFFVGAFLVVMGLLLLIDDLFPYGRQPYMASESGGLIAGLVAYVISFAQGLVHWALLAAFLISAAKIIRRKKKKA
jgi:hypothetical protein